MTEEASIDLDPRVKDLIPKLEALRSQDLDTQSRGFLFTTDVEVRRQIPIIKDKLTSVAAPLRVGLVISHGGLWSLGKEVQDLDLIIRLDMNTNQIATDRLWSASIVSGNLEEITKLAEDSQTEVDRQKWRPMKNEMNSYGEYHYLHNETEFKKTQDFLKSGKVAYVNGNLQDSKFMAELGGLLREQGGQIVFSDFSNALEWLDVHRTEEDRIKAVSQLKLLPFHEKVVCLYGMTHGLAGRGMIVANVAEGIEETTHAAGAYRRSYK